MGDDLMKKIKSEINKTGFPLELKVAELLKKRRYHVAQSSYYMDIDEGKPREIDIRALKNYGFRYNDQFAYFRHCLLIECKKSKDPWVFLCSKIGDYDAEFYDIPSYPNNKGVNLETTDYALLRIKHPFNISSMRGRSYFKLSSNDNKSSEIFKALTASIKATIYTIKKGFPLGECSLCYYYPIVVVDGRIFQATLNAGHIEVQEVNSVICSFFYESDTVKDGRYTIPVIKEENLNDFLNDLDDCLEIYGRATENNPTKTFPELEVK